MDNFFSSPRLFDDLDRRKLNSCGTLRPNRRDMPRDFGPKQLKLKRGDVRVSTRGGLTVLVWKDRREVYMLTNMDPPPAEGNFCDDSNRPASLTSWNGITGMWVSSTIQIVWPTAIRWIDVTSSGPRNCFPPPGSNNTQQLDSVIFMWGSIYPPRFQTPSGEEFD